MLRPAYAKQILDQMIFQRALEYEAGQMGLRVTPEEEAQRIKEILPDAWSGNTWLKDRYTTEVQTRTGMDVSEFESLLRDEMLVDKFRQLVTDGITVSQPEIEQEFRWRNEKVTIAYALIKPADLASSIHPSDAELSAWFTQESVALPDAGKAFRPIRAARSREASRHYHRQRRYAARLLQLAYRRIQSRKSCPRGAHSLQNRWQDRRRNRRNPARRPRTF